MTRLLAKKADPKTPVEDVLYGQFKRVTLDTPLGKVSRILERDHYCLVVHNQRLCMTRFLKLILLVRFISYLSLFPADTSDTVEERTVVVGIVTQIDLLNHITSHVQI